MAAAQAAHADPKPHNPLDKTARSFDAVMPDGDINNLSTSAEHLFLVLGNIATTKSPKEAADSIIKGTHGSADEAIAELAPRSPPAHPRVCRR